MMRTLFLHDYSAFDPLKHFLLPRAGSVTFRPRMFTGIAVAPDAASYGGNTTIAVLKHRLSSPTPTHRHEASEILLPCFVPCLRYATLSPTTVVVHAKEMVLE